MESATPSTDEIDRPYGVSVIDLTDEELQAVDPLPPERRLVVFPFLDQLEEAERDVATLVAFRSLAARGLVRPPTEAQVEVAMSADGENPSIEIGLDESIVGVIRTRKAAPTVVCAQRTIGERSDYCYWYVVDDEAALEEFVETKGLHRFRAMETRLVPGALYGYLNPERAAGRDGATFQEAAIKTVDGQTPAVELQKLGEAHAIGEFLVRGPQASDHPRIVAVAAGPGGLHVAEVRFGSGEPVRIREVSAATLHSRIEQILDPAIAPAP
jgi:hypothetical protein